MRCLTTRNSEFAFCPYKIARLRERYGVSEGLITEPEIVGIVGIARNRTGPRVAHIVASLKTFN